jgi:methyl-accepting chemotaxis protein
VAGSTEEQNAVARDISMSMQQAAAAVDGIGDSVNEIATATRAAETSTKKVKESSQSLAV